MAKDAVLEIRIDNPQARQAFIDFWRSMEAQGYSYEFEALCNVWVGFDDGRKALARKVLETMTALSVDTSFSGHWRNGFLQCQSDTAATLRELFQREGVKVEEGS